MFLFALVVGLAHVYPDIKFIHELGDDYRGIAITPSNDEVKYLAMINTIYKGQDICLGGFDNYEQIGQPWTFGFLPVLALGVVGKLFNITVINLDMLMTFLLPAILFVLLYFFILRLSESFSLAVIGSISLILGYSVFTANVQIIKETFMLSYSSHLWFLRPISPQFNHILLILALILIYESLCSNKIFLSWAAGILTGLLFYVFIYYWTFIYAGLSVLFFVFLARRENLYRRKIFTIFFLSVLISVPYWLNFWRLLHHPHYRDLEYFLNVINSRRPILPVSYILSSSIILFTYYKKEINLSFWYIFSFLVGGLICLNQHIITGKVMFPGHWMGYSNKTVLIVSLFVSLKNIRESVFIRKINNVKWSKYLIFFVYSIVLFLVAFQQQENFYKSHKDYYSQKQSMADVFMWLRNYTDKEDVVLTDPFTSSFPEPDDVLLYAHNFVFLPISVGTLRSKEDLEDRYLICLALFGYNEKEAEEKAFSFQDGKFFIRMRAIAEYGGGVIDPLYVDYLKKRYVQIIKDTELKVLNKYRLDYILLNKNNYSQERLLRRYGNLVLTKTYEDNIFVIIKIERGR